jgi:hypothetical protein
VLWALGPRLYTEGKREGAAGVETKGARGKADIWQGARGVYLSRGSQIELGCSTTTVQGITGECT